MQTLYSSCDIGSVLIGDGNWTFAVPNIGGDGTTEIKIFDSDAEWSKHPWSRKMHFISSVQGRFGIFDYDCAFHELLSGDMTIDNAMVILNGRYGVYNADWKVAFVKWETYIT